MLLIAPSKVCVSKSSKSRLQSQNCPPWLCFVGQPEMSSQRLTVTKLLLNNYGLLTSDLKVLQALTTSWISGCSLRILNGTGSKSSLPSSWYTVANFSCKQIQGNHFNTWTGNSKTFEVHSVQWLI